ncbi:hypothetical protein KCG44_10095 [Pacificimonas sp. WHA3]|uniref:Peptidase M14 domain-containing protein n=1 Tax=Pacificimonas pallii TaxID=2827236 RepID=A0ABS6SGZ9_9SPHN|nr:M14 family zinc carboxypeptidase [Pacificimonas pallii]MBV7257132.1 hypothetical protein [Pacificimonas pallii]
MTITSPHDFLGFDIGERPVSHEQIRLYAKELADQSEFVEHREYGTTSSGQKLFTLIIGTPRNLERHVDVKLDPEKIRSGNKRYIEQTPLVAWIGGGIHGNELSGVDSAILTAYRLAAGQDEITQNIRANVLTYIDPLFNPEGRQRALAHTNALRRQQSAQDHQDMVHNEFWMHGRGNHYLFDLNRDAIFQTQQQSRFRVAAIRAAEPQLFVDAHEMGWDDTFLFAIPARPLNPHLPDGVHESWLELGEDQAAAFDEMGRSYYTRAWNEVFYPGYYDIWPAYFGAVPMLYEQSATSGLSVRQSNGNLVDFRTAVENQYRSTIANLATVARDKDRYLKRWMEARAEAAGRNAKDNPRTYVILPGNGYKYRETLRILLSQGVEVEVLQEPVTARNLSGYKNDLKVTAKLPAGTLKVSADQPLGNLVRNILDAHTPFSPEFLREERRSLDLGEATQLYDVTAWSLPLAFNIEAYWSRSPLDGRWVDARQTALAAPKPPVGAANYAYIYRDDSLQATARLLQSGVKVRVAKAAFTHDGEDFRPGTFLVRHEEQVGDIRPLIDAEQAKGAIELFAAHGARILSGPDLGGDSFPLLRQPKVAILGGQGVSQTSFGAVWHLFDEKVEVPATLLNMMHLGFFDLSSYNAMILPEVDGDLSELLPGAAMKALANWVDQGGTLLTLGNASFYASEAGIISSVPRSRTLDDTTLMMVGRSIAEIEADDFLGASSSDGKTPQQTRAVLGASAKELDARNEPFDFADTAQSFADQRSATPAVTMTPAQTIAKIRTYLPHGAYLQAHLKPEHWMAYGVTERLPVLFRESDALSPGPNAALIGRFASMPNLMLSGLVWPEATGYISGSAYLLLERKGRGKVISFASDPLFRGYSLGTERLFMNAVYLGTGRHAE